MIYGYRKADVGPVICCISRSLVAFEGEIHDLGFQCCRCVHLIGEVGEKRLYNDINLELSRGGLWQEFFGRYKFLSFARCDVGILSLGLLIIEVMKFLAHTTDRNWLCLLDTPFNRRHALVTSGTPIALFPCGELPRPNAGQGRAGQGRLVSGEPASILALISLPSIEGEQGRLVSTYT